VLGKNPDGTSKEINLLPGVKSVRIKKGGGIHVPYALEMSSNVETLNVIAQNYGHWGNEMKLEEDEVIIGVFGKNYDDDNGYMKSLGFVLGK
jgi:hypothetical protein